MQVTIAVESPLQDDVRTLIADLNAVLLVETPPEFCSHMTAEEMAEPDTTVFVARDEEGRAVACGALRRHADGVGEVKRMYTIPAEQGQGIGGQILEHIEMRAREEGLAHVLETGQFHEAAYRVYERGGFTRCGPVLHYPDTGWSVFYEKPLAT